MRFLIGTATASILIASTAVIGVTPAFADDDIYFNHAKGTMTGSGSAAAPSSTDPNGRYTASYHQYMQMDPRDMKVDPNASQNVDGNDIYFNHSKGTMSGN